MVRFTTVLWDVDGTLLDFAFSQRVAFMKCFRSIGLTGTEEQLVRYSQINDSMWKLHEKGEMTGDELKLERFRRLFAEYGIEGVDLNAFHQEFQEGLGNVAVPLDDSLELCKSLRGMVRQYVVSNGDVAVQTHKLQLAGFLEVMDGLFFSQEAGAPKPAKAFFDYCFLGIPEKDPGKILIVGDSLTSDIQGGIRAGISTCWYRPEGTVNDSPYRPDYEISDLHSVCDILGVFDTWQNRRDKS